jgi:GNAT superfamily N-acetyltransferase
VAIRALIRDEIELIWAIDRSEVHHRIYKVVNGLLILVPAYFEIPGWHPRMVENDRPRLYECFDRGGTFLGSFDDDSLNGVSVVDTNPVGSKPDCLQLLYLYVSRSARGQGIGSTLFAAAAEAAGALSAKVLYVSSVPTENTVNFYLRRGSSLATRPDPDLFAAEPDDVHLTYSL